MALGHFGGGNGTLADPFLIEDAFDLNAIRHTFNNRKCYRLVNDINLCDLPNYDKNGWTPIETFSGYIDGNFHSIHNLYIDSDDTCVGFIKYLTPGSLSPYKLIENLNIENAEVHGKNISAILAGRAFFNNNNNTSYECYWNFNGVTVQGQAYGNNIGGLIGEILYSTNSYIPLMKNCHISIEAHPKVEGCSVGLVCGIDRSSNTGLGYPCWVYDSVIIGNIVQEDEDNIPTIRIDKQDIEKKVGYTRYYPMKTTYSNCYCNKLNYDQQIPDGIKVLDDEQLYDQASYSGLVDNKAYKLNGTYNKSKELDEKYWVFKHNKIPDLFFTDNNNNNNNNIRIKDQFYTYDETSSSFIEIDAPDLLDSDEAKKHKINDFNAINANAYVKLLDKFKGEDLAGKAFIYNSKKSPLKFTTNVSQDKVSLKRDSGITLKNSNKEIQKKTFSFEADLTNEFSLCNKRDDIGTGEVNG